LADDPFHRDRPLSLAEREVCAMSTDLLEIFTGARPPLTAGGDEESGAIAGGLAARNAVGRRGVVGRRGDVGARRDRRDPPSAGLAPSLPATATGGSGAQRWLTP